MVGKEVVCDSNCGCDGDEAGLFVSEEAVERRRERLSRGRAGQRLDVVAGSSQFRRRMGDG